MFEVVLWVFLGLMFFQLARVLWNENLVYLKEKRKTQKEVQKKTLDEEIHELEVSLGMVEDPNKWRIWKSGTVWMLGKDGIQNIACSSFNAAREEYIRRSKSPHWEKIQDGVRRLNVPPKTPSAVSTPKGSHYTLPTRAAAVLKLRDRSVTDWTYCPGPR